MRYRSTYRSRGRRRSSSLTDYLLPFLIVIAVGIIVVLAFNLWKAVYGSEPEEIAKLYVVEGSASMKTWGTDDFFQLTTEALLFQGDELQTAESSKVIIEFFDGTILRVDGGSDLILEEIVAEEMPMIKLWLVDGAVWVNKVYRDGGNTNVSIRMNNITVNSLSASIFALESDFNEEVRGIGGEDLFIDVMAEDGSKVVEAEKVGVGQEMVFTDEVLARYWEFQSPTVLSGSSDEFKQSLWYAWNIKEDASPTNFESGEVVTPPEGVDDELLLEDPEGEEGSEGADASEGVDENGEEEDVLEETTTVEEESTEVSGSLSKPTIVSVAGMTDTNADGYYVVSSKVATLTGAVSGASQVIVSGYTLQEFAAGGTTWTYYANADYELMEEGENIYDVTAIDADGKKSEVLTVKVLYTPPKTVVEPVQPEEVVPEETTTESSTDA